MSHAIPKRRVSCRRAVRLFAATTALVAPGMAWADAEPAAPASEIVVTANKRSESIQKVPISMTALGSATLDQHQVQSLDDYQKLVPSVSTQSFGPGQSEIYFRGITTGIGPVHVLPTSSLYIDETPVTTPSGAPDLHMYDIARVEALAGPQGTLFGASAMSGALRIITNKPKIGKWEGGYDLELNQFGHGGGTGGQAQGYLNIPLNERMALRLVGFYDKQGGYISNTYGTRTYERPHATSDGSVVDAPYTINNSQYAKKNFNDVNTLGGRAELLIDLGDNWTAEPEVMYQHQIAHGTYLYDPNVGDLEVHDFTPDHRRDDWVLASLTVQGKLSDWDVTYSGSYFQRVTDTVQDYSYYSVAYDSYTNYNYLKNASGQDINPTQIFHAHNFYTKQSQELRFNSPADAQLRLTAGLFYQRQTANLIVDYEIPGLATAVDPFSPPIPGAPSDDPFYNNTRQVYHDYAAFGEVSYDIVPHVTAVAGIRGFVTDNSWYGFSGSLFTLQDLTSCVAQTVTACPSVNRGYHETGQTHRASLRWQITPDKMVYATYSTGYRPGGVNRDIIYPGQSIMIPSFKSDTISNYEAGWKTAWLDKRLVVDAALFWEVWDRVQYPLPGLYASYYVVNAGTARSRGIEGNVTARPLPGVTLYASAAYTDARLTSDFGTLAPAGTRMPLQPEFNINANARYEFKTGNWANFVQASLFHQSSSTEYLTTAIEDAIGPVSGFTTIDFSLGTQLGRTTISAYVQNAFDSRGVLSKNTVCAPATCAAYMRYYPVKPQLFGIKFGQKF
jgi:iron complex outermembrane recepter protein